MPMHDTCMQDAIEMNNMENPMKRTPTVKRLPRNKNPFITPIAKRMLRRNVDVESGKHTVRMEGGILDRMLSMCPSRAEEVMWMLLFRFVGVSIVIFHSVCIGFND